MRVLLMSLLVVHGLLHLVGFIKAYRLASMPAVRYPISKVNGLLWLVATGLFVATGFLFFYHSEGWWLVAVVAVTVSEYLMLTDWEDAGLGTAANITILLTVLVSYGMYQLHA